MNYWKNVLENELFYPLKESLQMLSLGMKDVAKLFSSLSSATE
jgi:hypothetical protein